MDNNLFTRAEAERRIGLIVPSSNTSIEIEFACCMPRGFSVHAQRMPLFADVTPESVEPRNRNWRFGHRVTS